MARREIQARLYWDSWVKTSNRFPFLLLEGGRAGPFVKNLLLLFLAAPCSMWDLSSPTRDRTRVPCSGSAESQPLDHQGSPMSWSLKWGEGRGRSRGQTIWVAWVVCPPPWWYWVQGSCTVPCFFSWHLRSGGWVLVSFKIILLLISCPNCPCMQLFLVPYSFFAFCCWRKHLSRCKHCCSKGSQVPGPNLSHSPLRDFTPLILKG